MQVRGQVVLRRHRQVGDRGAELGRRARHQVAHEPQQVEALVRVEEQQPGEHLGPDRMELERERGRDAEVAAAAVQRPEQVRVLVRAGGDPRPVGGHQLDRDEVVAGEAVLALQPARPAAEREPGDAGGRHPPAGGREPVLLRGAVELGPRAAGSDARGARLGIDLDLVHRPHVDHEAAVVQRHARDRVAARPHGDLQIPVAAEAQRRDHVLRPSGTARSAPGRLSIIELKTVRASS